MLEILGILDTGKCYYSKAMRGKMQKNEQQPFFSGVGSPVRSVLWLMTSISEVATLIWLLEQPASI